VSIHIPSALPVVSPQTPHFAPTAAPVLPPSQTLVPTFHPTSAPVLPPSQTLVPTFHPTIIPTFKPTFKPSTSSPTFQPTEAVIAKMVFSANITMNNIHNASDVKEGDIIAVKNATAISLDVPYDNVYYLGLKEVTRRRLFSSFFQLPSSSFSASMSPDITVQEKAKIDLLVGSSFLVLLQITTPITTTMNATKIYQDLKTTLDEAINSGDFTTILQAVSVALGVTAFKDANATSVTISTATLLPVSSTSSSTSSSSSDESFPSWAIYVIAIGGFNLILLAGITIYCLKRDGTGVSDSSHPQKTPSAHAAYTGVSSSDQPGESRGLVIVHPTASHQNHEEIIL
jgi:hypothetical protein